MAEHQSSASIATRAMDGGDNLEPLCQLPEGGVDLVCIDPPCNPNRNDEVFQGRVRNSFFQHSRLVYLGL